MFEEMQGRFSRHVSPGESRGYNHFRDAWNAGAGRRYLSVLGGEGEVLIYRKTTLQLQEFYDKLEEERSASVMVNESAARRQEELTQVYRHARAVAQTPSVSQVHPLQYPTQYPVYFPCGVPMTLNPQVSMANVRVRQSPFGCAPFDVHNGAQNTVLKTLPAGLSFKQICKKCGRLRSDHAGNNKYSFGKNCNWTCCGRCRASNELHDRWNVPMGFYCSLKVSQGAILGCSEQYDDYLSSFATTRKRKRDGQREEAKQNDGEVNI